MLDFGLQCLRLIQWNTTDFLGQKQIPKSPDFVESFSTLIFVNGLCISSYLIFGAWKSR